MSYLQVTAVRPSLRVPEHYNTLRVSAPNNIFNLHNHAIKPIIGSSKKCTDLMKCNMIQRSSASHYQKCTPVCSFGGKGESKNGNEGSPWKSMEQAMSSFKKEQSLEDVLRQQMEKQDYYDPSGGGGGGGGSGGGGFGGGTEDDSFAALWDDIVQATLAFIALVVVYLWIIAGDQVMQFIRETFKFVAGKKGPRLRTIMYAFSNFYQKFRAKVPYDPYWLEKEILATPTWWDSPEKYEQILKAEKMMDSDRDTDTDERSSSDNIYNDEDSEIDNKAYNDDDDDDDDDNDNDNDNNGYSEDVDDDY